MIATQSQWNYSKRSVETKYLFSSIDWKVIVLGHRSSTRGTCGVGMTGSPTAVTPLGEPPIGRQVSQCYRLQAKPPSSRSERSPSTRSSLGLEATTASSARYRRSDVLVRRTALAPVEIKTLETDEDSVHIVFRAEPHQSDVLALR